MGEYIKAPGWFHRLPSYFKLFASSIVATIISLALSWVRMEGMTRVMVAWDIFSLCMISIAGATFFSMCPKQIRVLAGREDSSRAIVFAIVLSAIIGSLLGILLLLSNKSGWLLSKGMETFIYITGVTFSWILLHIMFTYRYAHIYYGKRSSSQGDLTRGLDIPGEDKCPDYLDFAYFSFVIGMTFQVSDIQVSGRKMRRLVLLHGLLSFLFNTVIVALTINVVVDFKS
jgi:uncharacterized membrane protein